LDGVSWRELVEERGGRELGRRESCISSSACLFSSFSPVGCIFADIDRIGYDRHCICDGQFSLCSGLGLDLIALCERRDGVPGSSDV
jgi:hypothetical protein